MKISTRGTYALRMLIDLAQQQGEGYVCLGDICARQNISRKYLEQIMPLLQKGGLLKACRGNCGGYRLAKAPSEINVAEILLITEGSLALVPCLQEDKEECENCGICPAYPVWQGLEKVVSEYLSGITLDKLADKQL